MTVRELRQLTGLSQRKFAEKFHLHGVKALQSWEQGVRNCPDYVLWMMARILELENEVRTYGKEHQSDKG